MTVTCQKPSAFFPLLNPFVYVVSQATILGVFLRSEKISCWRVSVWPNSLDCIDIKISVEPTVQKRKPCY